MLPSTLKKLAKYFLIFWLFCFGLAQLAKYLITKDTPPFLNEMVETSKESPIVLKKIGEYQGYEYTFNEHDLDKDTLKYKFSIRGTEGEMALNGYAINKNGKWMPDKIDTVFTQ
jgi:hypothetical protein